MMESSGKQKKLSILLIMLLSFAVIFSFFQLADRMQSKNRQGSIRALNSIKTTPSIAPNTTVIRGFNYGFKPSILNVKQGELVKLKLISDDSPHTFTIDQLGINKEFTYGKDADIEFTLTAKGKFRIYCAVPGHAESGMVGELIVE